MALSSRWVVGSVRARGVVWGAGVGVVLGAVTAALVNELHGGWVWWVACALAVLVSAGLAMWLASRAAPSRGVRVGRGGVFGGRDIRGPVRTRVWGQGTATGADPAEHGESVVLGEGAVVAGRDIHGGVTTDVEGGAEGPGQP